MAVKNLDTVSDRSIAAVLGSAAGDALSIPYGTSPDLLSKAPADQPLQVTSSNQWSQGEWASSTAMSVPVLQAMSKDFSLGPGAPVEVPNYVAQQWLEWQKSGGKGGDDRLSDLLKGTAAEQAKSSGGVFPFGTAMTKLAAKQGKSGNSDNNRAPARLTSLALGFLADGQETALVKAAIALTDLTEPDQDAEEASILVALGVRNAVLTGKLDLEKATEFLPADRRQTWKERIADGYKVDPEDFQKSNHSAIGAFKAAVAANAGGDDVATVIDKAVRGGGQSDRVAAIAGAWAGARFGSKSVPQWSSKLHGWPGKADDLKTLVSTVMNRYKQ